MFFKNTLTGLQVTFLFRLNKEGFVTRFQTIIINRLLTAY